LIELLRRESSNYVIKAAAEALEKIRDSRAVEPLPETFASYRREPFRITGWTKQEKNARDEAEGTVAKVLLSFGYPQAMADIEKSLSPRSQYDRAACIEY
jgi:hypothetical protein